MGNLRFLPTVGGEEKVDNVVIHFGFALEIVVYHFPNWRYSVWESQDFEVDVGQGKRFYSREIERRRVFN
jgi:hypothetical protein